MVWDSLNGFTGAVTANAAADVPSTSTSSSMYRDRFTDSFGPRLRLTSGYVFTAELLEFSPLWNFIETLSIPLWNASRKGFKHGMHAVTRLIQRTHWEAMVVAKVYEVISADGWASCIKESRTMVVIITLGGLISPMTMVVIASESQHTNRERRMRLSQSPSCQKTFGPAS